jgi:hypothetical protein
MKTSARILRSIGLGVFLAILQFGCATTSSTGGGLTLEQTHQQVEDAMLTFRNVSISGNLTTAEREGIQAAYQQYQDAYGAALTQAGSDKKAVAPESVKTAAEGVVARVSAIP